MRRTTAARSRGDFGEGIAAEYLERHGLKILERNYRYERGEIDLVAEDGDELVFVEVKTRRTKTFGEPEEAVHELKQERIRDAAEGYLLERCVEEKVYRFDVVAILLTEEEPEINHIRDAF